MKKHYISGIIIFVIGTAFSTNVFAEGDLGRGEAKYKVCAACHGENGEGRKIANAPRISGQHSWYIARQLNNFKNGVRGTHINDITGMQMRPMAMTLATDQDIEDVLVYVESLNGRGKHSGVKGNIEKGESAYAVCVTCHGANGQGIEALNAPKIAGLPDWYVARQLHSFKKGIRGTHKQDVFGMQMRPMAMALANDETINNVAAYVATFTEKLLSVTKEASESSPTEPSTVSIKGSADNGKSLYAVCVSCHGADGSGNKALNAPRISGQMEWYVARQLVSFKSGLRGTHEEDIYGQQMRPMSMTLTNKQSIADVAAYVSTLKGSVSETTIQGDASAGKASYAVCASCHGANGEGSKELNAPKIAGQQDWYVVRQLKNFKKRIRGTDPNDIYGLQMIPMAMTLADDTAINNVAAYISTFK